MLEDHHVFGLVDWVLGVDIYNDKVESPHYFLCWKNEESSIRFFMSSFFLSLLKFTKALMSHGQSLPSARSFISVYDNDKEEWS